MSRILVTGATGLIGRNLLKKLDGDIRVIARSKKDLVNLRKQFPNITVIVGDISDERLVKRSLRYVDTVYHLAALRAVGLAEREVESCIDTNIIGTNNILKHFHGDTFITLSTDKAVQISSVYGASKFIMEKLVKQYALRNIKTKYHILRSGNVFGSKDSVMSVWKDSLEKGKEINVTDLSATRYFCTVNQIIDYIIKGRYEGMIKCLNLKSTSLSLLLKAMELKYGKAKKINIIGRQIGENKHEKLLNDGVSSDKAEKYTVNELLRLI